MNDDSQREFDDELLSAYLDDELSPQERARVESRLATDPASRQTLEQLRNVSQAVRELPREVVGRELRESVLRRAEAAKQAGKTAAAASTISKIDAPNGSPAGLGDAMPKLTIGRTPRGWVWASLAVAAALLIMVFQPGGEREAEISDLARRDDRLAVEREELGRGTDLRVSSESTSSESVPGLSSRSGPDSVVRDLSRSEPVVAKSAAEAPASGTAETPADRFATSPKAAAPEVDADIGSSDGTTSLAETGSVAEEDVVVVHVLAKRKALENKVFDQLLASNGIVVDPAYGKQVAPPTPAATAAPANAAQNEAASQRAEGRGAGEAADQSKPAAAEVDVVLVDAPSEAILGCMSDLNKDLSNYVGVSVDESAAVKESSLDDVSTLKKVPAKKLATDLGQFSRGVVPQQQKDAYARNKANYYNPQVDAEAVRSGRAIGGGLQYGVAGQDKLQQLSAGSSMEQGRARRVHNWSIDYRHDVDGEPLGLQPRGSEAKVEELAQQQQVQQLQARRQLNESKTRSGRESDRLQVLFVLSPEDESSPSPAAKRAE
jgi:hypothetical protein